MKVCCVISLASPHRGDYNEYSQHTYVNIKKNHPKFMSIIIMSAAIGFFCKGLKNKFEIAVVNEPSVLEPLKFYCILLIFESV